jgi:phasin
MADNVERTPGFSPKVREMAEQSVVQAKKAYEQYAGTTERMMNTMEDSLRHAWTGAREVNHRMVAFAAANAQAGFDYAERLVRAKDTKEIASLQQEYLREATERLARQMRDLNELATQVAKEAVETAKPKP